MNDERLINEMRSLRQEIRKLMEGGWRAKEEPINEEEACKLLGIARRTIQNMVSSGRLDGTYIINRIGKRMYYKSKLYG